jgi:hypothetical protein
LPRAALTAAMAPRWPAARRKRSARLLGLAALAFAALVAYAFASVFFRSYTAPTGAAGTAGDRCAAPPR